MCIFAAGITCVACYSLRQTKVKVALHVRVNFRESYREHLATTFRRESKSWLADSLRSLLRAPNCVTSQSMKFPYTRESERLLVREQEHGGGRFS